MSSPLPPGPNPAPDESKPAAEPPQKKRQAKKPQVVQAALVDDKNDDEDETLVGRFVLFNVIPSWVFSFLAHALLILLTAIMVIPRTVEKTITFEGGEVSSAAFESIDFSLDDMEEEMIDPLQTEMAESAAAAISDVTDASAPEATVDIGEILAGIDESFEMEIPGAVLSADMSTETGLRNESSRNSALSKYGGTAKSEAAVDLALKWIVDHQLPDGGWSLNHQLGPGNHRTSPDPTTIADRNGKLQQLRNAATALAILPLLGNGQTHQTGKYKASVKKGLEFLKAQGIRRGRGISYLGPDDAGMYSHGLVAIALCEAFAMTEDPELAPYAQGTIWFIEDAQDNSGGGWRYRPNQRGDTSVVGWQVMALKSARGSGLQVNPKTFKRTARFLDTMANESLGMYGYDKKPDRPNSRYRSCTAIGVLCRMYLGADKDAPAIHNAIEYIRTLGPDNEGPHNRVSSVYYNYYATQVMKHNGGPEWKEWNLGMRDYLVKKQGKSGPTTGSWMFDEGFAEKAGRLYATSLACMTLEIYYRYLPLYDESAVNEDFPLD